MNFNDIYSPNYYGSVFHGALNKNFFYLKKTEKEITPFSTFIKIFNKYGFLKYIFFYNIDFGLNIKLIEFEININGFGLGKIVLSEKTKISLIIEDIIEIYFNDKMIYKGFLAENYNETTRELIIYPFSKRLQERYYNGSFSNVTIKEIIKTVLTSVKSYTAIEYNPGYIDTGFTNIITIEFKNEKIFEIIEKLTKMCQDRFWYIDDKNFLHIEKIENKKIKKYFMLFTDKKNYEDIKIENNLKKIDAAYYKVFKNTGSGNVTYIGNVGDNSNYPPILLGEIRRIEGIYNINDIVPNNVGLDLAYAELKRNIKKKQTINIKNINLNEYIPQINDYLYFEYIEKIETNNIPILNKILDNVTNIKYNIKEDGINCDIQCGELKETEGEELYRLKKKIEILENINKI